LIARAKVKDPQFRSSINYGIRFGLTLFYLLVLFVVAIFVAGFWKALALLIMGIFSAWLMPKVFVLLRDMIYGIRWLRRGRRER
jgi:uncharacterized membrane protein